MRWIAVAGLVPVALALVHVRRDDGSVRGTRCLRVRVRRHDGEPEPRADVRFVAAGGDREVRAAKASDVVFPR